MVGPLIYYVDTVAFYQAHRAEIDEALSELVNDTGSQPAALFGDKWDEFDPLANEDMNQNLLAWFGFEEAARAILESEAFETEGA